MKHVPALLISMSFLVACKKSDPPAEKGKSGDAKPVEAKPAETKPVEAKPAPASPPTHDQALAVVTAWVDAIGRGKTSEVAAALSKGIHLRYELTTGGSAVCPDGGITSAANTDLPRVADCMVAQLGGDPAVTRAIKKKLTAAAVTDAPPPDELDQAGMTADPGLVYVAADLTDAYQDSYGFVVGVALVDGKPVVSDAFLQVAVGDD